MVTNFSNINTLISESKYFISNTNSRKDYEPLKNVMTLRNPSSQYCYLLTLYYYDSINKTLLYCSKALLILLKTETRR